MVGNAPVKQLGRRLQQTRDALLAGLSEKQVARQLGLSPRTLHHYVEQLYHHYSVCSRGELMARFVSRNGKPTRGGGGGR